MKKRVAIPDNLEGGRLRKGGRSEFFDIANTDLHCYGPLILLSIFFGMVTSFDSTLEYNRYVDILAVAAGAIKQCTPTPLVRH